MDVYAIAHTAPSLLSQFAARSTFSLIRALRRIRKERSIPLKRVPFESRKHVSAFDWSGRFDLGSPIATAPNNAQVIFVI